MMINNKIFLTLFIFMILLTGCDFGGDSGSSRTGMYYVISDDGNYLIPRHFTKVITGVECTVWQDDYIVMTEATAQNIADQFDSLIYNSVTTAFASPYDMDGDGKVAIFVYSGDAGLSGSYIAGYFYPGDMYDQSGSNRMDVLYLNGSPSNHQPASQNFYGTIAHEFQHMCNFSWNVINEHGGNSDYQMVTWADEGMAEVSNALCYGFSSNHDRVLYFQNDSSGDFGNGNVSLTLWRSDVDNYALVYSFMAFLYKMDGTIFDHFYKDGFNNNTSEINTILASGTVGLTGIDKQYASFLSSLYSATAADFPNGFFPSGFSAKKTGSANAVIKPYAFVFRTSLFTVENANLTYLNNYGQTVPDSNGENFNTAVIATWLNSSSWTTSLASSWGSTENTYSASTSILQTSMLMSASVESDSVSEPQKIDFVFPNNGKSPIVLDYVDGKK